jgi:formylglycine-generating enzyme required for sulfatase activity/energy-coupling factor transporter ATP-binding protein EcfA2
MPDYTSSLDHIMEACKKIWETPHHIHYTNHGIGHSEKIIEKLSKLLTDQNVRLEPVETFILHAACYLHDVGMQCSQPDLLKKVADINKNTPFPFSYEPLEKTRAKHAELSYHMIKNPFNPQSERYDNLPDLGLSGVDNLIVDAIAKISMAHSDSDYQKYCSERDDFIPDGPDDGTKMLLLAVLLRLGDALDADRMRCNWDKYWEMQQNLPVESQAHFWKHYWVVKVKIGKGRIGLKFAIPSKHEQAKPGILSMAEKYIRFHSADLEKIWNEFDIRIGINKPECKPNSPELPKPMPSEVENFFITYNPSADTPTPVLQIPKKYRNWIIDQCENMDVSKLVGSKDRVILVKMPEIFIPLYTDPLDKEGRSRKDIQEAAKEERKQVNIESMVPEMEYLLIQGQAGSGKTTLLKHLAYTIIHKESVKKLEGCLPVLVFLKDVQNIVNRLNNLASAATGERFLIEYFNEMDNGLDVNTVKQFCREGKAIFFIDGLDEIDQVAREKVVASLAALRSDYGCKMVLSGRPHGIENAVVMSRFGDRRVKINNLNMDQIESFIKKWFKYIYTSESGLDVKTSEGMMGEIKAHPNISVLLDTPLMLTAICILYYEGKKLPEQRADLYKRFVDNLIYKRFPDPERVSSFLMIQAFKVHNRGVREFDRADALETMQLVYPQEPNETDIQCRQRLDQKFTAIEQNCGLLKFEKGHYEFWHLSFQEFLTARYIVDFKTRYDQEIKKYWGNDWYQEVIELFIGYLSMQNRGWANEIVEGKLKGNDQSPFRYWRLASRCLLDIHKDMRNNEVLDLADNRLLSIIEVGAAPNILVDAGETLGWLGDPRHLQEFVTIEGGKYELEGLGKVIIKPLEIGKYPVTNQWFAEFVNTKGYETPAYWTLEGQKWLKKSKATCPEYWHDRKWKCPNAPVVGVSWYEADAFCKWLSSKDKHYEYRLPTEQEWQAAAAGKEGREYAWVDDFDKNKCNVYETKIGKTSAVGIFIKGNTPEGVADLSGNVWEWTRTCYKSQKLQEDFKIDQVWELGPVLRGGSWFINLVDARCAYRSYFYPHYRHFNIGFRLSRTKKG